MIEKGRINQKVRTREALIEAANRLLTQGNIQFSIEEVAKEARVSTATAYRYFSNAETLRTEAPLHYKTRNPEMLFENIDKDDWKERLEKILKYHEKLYLENEIEFRLFLSSVLRESVKDSGHNLRGGRRIPLIEEALEPLKEKMGEEDFKMLTYTLSIFFGIESVIVLKDVCQLDNDDILKVWDWAIKHIIDNIFSHKE